MLIFRNSQKGVLIIEILIAVVIIVVALVYLLSSTVFSLKIQDSLKNYLIATNLTQEAMEAVRNFLEGTSWNTNGIRILTADINYYPQKSGDIPPKWTLVLGEETINDFKRKVVFSDVMRDADGNIVDSGGTEDPDTKEVTVIVSWENKSVEIVTYLTNWKQ